MQENEVNTNYTYYNQNLKELKKQYLNQYVVISKKKVIFHAEDLQEVLEFARDLAIGSYIVQKIEASDEKSIQTFHTRVSF